MVLQGKSILDVTKTLNAEGIPSTNGKKWLKTTIHTMLDNEAYTGTLSQDVVRGMLETASRGYFLGSKAPFGYNRVKVSDGVKDRHTLEVDPVAAPIVMEIFESFRRGNGLKEICKELNGRGITNKGRRWQKNVFHYLLTNEAYTGTALLVVRSAPKTPVFVGSGFV